MSVATLPRMVLPRTALLPKTALAAFALDSARDFACDVLRAAGIVSVVPAGGVRDAVRTAQDQPIDIIVTDWPTDGTDLGNFLDALRTSANGARRDTPVMFLTSRDGRADLDAARQAGVDAYVVSPVSPAMLKHRLSRMPTNAWGRCAA
jgi:CheY-like chemotaxis protein